MRKLDDYLTVGQAAELLGVSAWTLRYWDRTGKLRPTRHPLSGYRLYRRDQLEALLRRAAGEPADTQEAGRRPRRRTAKVAR